MYVMYSHQKPCLIVFLFQENKSFGASYHLHSSSDPLRTMTYQNLINSRIWKSSFTFVLYVRELCTAKFYKIDFPELTLIRAAGGVYDFRNFKEIYLCNGLSSDLQNLCIPRKTSREYILLITLERKNGIFGEL